MTTEKKPQITNTSENVQTITNKIKELWHTSPQEFQANLALQLLGDVMESDERDAIREAFNANWPLTPQTLEKSYPHIAISRDDLGNARFNQEEIDQITDEDLTAISKTMCERYINNFFWPELEYVTANLLEQKEQLNIRERLAKALSEDGLFYAWMNKIDQHVWQVAGCSIYDLPDYNFREMFEDSADPAEVVNTVLSEAGFNAALQP